MRYLLPTHVRDICINASNDNSIFNCPRCIRLSAAVNEVSPQANMAGSYSDIRDVK